MHVRRATILLSQRTEPPLYKLPLFKGTINTGYSGKHTEAGECSANLSGGSEFRSNRSDGNWGYSRATKSREGNIGIYATILPATSVLTASGSTSEVRSRAENGAPGSGGCGMALIRRPISSSESLSSACTNRTGVGPDIVTNQRLA